jgi:uncharacterized membrane protein
VLVIAIAVYAVGFSVFAILRHLAYNTGRYDLGNMVQAVWATAHGHPLQVTSGGGEQFTRLGSHADPILVAFAPLWWVWPSPSMLLVAQTIAIALGAIPVFWLARKHLGSERAGLALAIAYLLYPPLQWLSVDEFHPVALACPLLLFAFWYLDEDRLIPFAVFAGLACLTKEEIPLVVAGFGIWYAISRRRWLTGGAIAAVGGAVAAIAAGFVIPHLSPTGESRFNARYGEVGGSAGGILKTAVTHPLRLLEAAFSWRDLQYLANLLLPLLALSLLAPLLLVALVPELVLNLLSDVSTQTSIRYHYTAGEIPVLVAAAILGAAAIIRRRPGVAGPLVGALVVAALVANYARGPLPIWRGFPGTKPVPSNFATVTEHDRIADRALELVPDDVVVSSTNSLGAHLSARRRILSFPRVADATFIAVDETRMTYGGKFDELRSARELVRVRRNPDWRLVFSTDGILVFQRTRPATSTP